jgi:lipoate-protein ligase A
LTSIETNQFRLLDSGPQEAYLNMAVDEAVSRAVEAGRVPPTIRFYTWTRPAVSIGAFQLLQEVDLNQCEEDSIPVVRRITGGRALLHRDELTYSVICQIPSPFFPSNLQGCCRVIAEALQLGLRKIGLELQIFPQKAYLPSKPRPPDCFSTPSLYELTADGRKLVGSAQRRWLRVFLQHGSIPIKTDRGLEKKFIIGTTGNPVQKAARLSELIDPLPSMKKLKDALVFGFEKRLGTALKKGVLTPEENTQAQKLVQTRYAADVWTRRR